MRIRILFALALAAALVAVPVATSATRTTHAVQATLKMARIGPNGPNGSTFAGELVGKPTGRAAVVIRDTDSGSTSTGRAVVYARAGTIVVSTKNEIQAQPNGSVRFPGTFKVLDGTRRYKDATGRGTFDGVLRANGTVVTLKLKGKARY